MFRRRLCPLFFFSSCLVACGENEMKSPQRVVVQDASQGGLAQDAGFDSTEAATGWTVETYLRGSLAQVPPASLADLNLGAPVGAATTPSVLTGAPGSLRPTVVSSNMSLRVPLYSGAVAELNRGGSAQSAQKLTRTVTITSSDFDTFDNKVHLRLGFLPVFSTNVTGDATQAPFVFIQVVNQSRGGALVYSRFLERTQTDLRWTDDTDNQVSFLPWQSLDVVAGSDHIDVGDQIQISLVSANSESTSKEIGVLYVDGLASTLPLTTAVIYGPSGLSLPGTGTYTVRIANESANLASQANVIVMLPPEWQVSDLRQPNDSTCDTSVGQGNQVLVRCLVSNLGAGATRSLGFAASPSASSTGASRFDSLVTLPGLLPVMGPPLITVSSTTTAYADLSAALAERKIDPCAGVVTYDATFINNGPADVQSTQVAMILPASLTPLSWECVASASAQCAGGSSASGLGRLNLGAALAASGEIHCTISLAVPKTVSGDLFPAVFTKALDATPESFPFNNSSAARLRPQSWPSCQPGEISPGTVVGPAPGSLGSHSGASCFKDDDCALGTFCNPFYFCEAPANPNDSPWILEGAGGPAAGCHAGSQGSSMFAMWLMLSALAAFRLRQRLSLITLVCLTIVTVRPVHAAEESLSFPTNHFRVYVGNHDIYSVQGARIPKFSGVGLTLFGNYADRLLRVVARDRSIEQFILRSQTTLDMGLSMASERGYELSVVLPLTWQVTDRAAYFAAELSRAPDTFGIGDILVAPKVALWQNTFAAISVGVPLTLPTGRPRSFIGYAGPTAAPSVLASFGQQGDIQLLASAGYSFRPHRALGTVDIKDAFVWGAGGTLPIKKRGLCAEAKLSITGELGTGRGRKNANPTEVHAGVRYSPSRYLSLDVGAGTGLNNSVGMPRWRVFAGMTARTPNLRRDEPPAIRSREEEALPIASQPPLPSAESIPVPSVQVLPLEPEAQPENFEAPTETLLPIFFDLERSRLRPEAIPLLEKAKLWIEHLPPTSRCLIEGHADSHGSTGLNKRLTQARAESIKFWLVTHGISEDRLVARGCGTAYPVADNLTEEGRAKNRRAILRQEPRAAGSTSK